MVLYFIIFEYLITGFNLTVVNHLMRFVDSGELDAHEFVSGEIIREVRVFKANNPECERLKEIFDGLGGKVSYSEIRFALKCL